MPSVRHVDVAIIGGGIAGLAAAHRLMSTAPGVTFALIERDSHVGGRLGSATVAGVTLDTAADAFLARVPGAVDLCHELGIGHELVAPSTGNASVLVEGLLRPLPSGLVLGVPTDIDALAASGVLSADGFTRATEDELISRPLPHHDRSIAEAIATHLGREVVERLVDPLLGGISAANCDDLSIDAAAPQLARATEEPHLMAALRAQQAVSQRGQIGVTETRPVFLAPRGGVHTLAEKLGDILSNHLVLGSQINEIDRLPNGQWSVAGVLADHVIIATPAPVSARLLEPFSPEASQTLRSLRMASVALVLLAYETNACNIPPGSGALVPRGEARFVTAVSWWNHKWPHLATGDLTFIRASVGRIDDTTFHSMTNTDIVNQIHAELATMVGIQAEPVDSHVARWMDSFPQYDVGHLDRVARMEQVLANETRGVSLAGATLHGVGIPACIRSGREAADSALRRLSNSGAN
jgi:protoporphyrinogen/coproporphyrinogen III oxidase